MFTGLKFLQHLNISSNKLNDLGTGNGCSLRKSLKTIDMSYNQLYDIKILTNNSSFFSCFEPERLYLVGNQITEFHSKFNFFNRSLKILDLKHNKIDSLFVSTEYLNHQKIL